MIIVSTFYVITWTPINLYYLIVSTSSDITFNRRVHYVLIFVAFLYICTNPFIYATKFDPVKRILGGLIPCKKQPLQQAGGSVEMTGTGTTAATHSVKRRN